MLGWKIVEEEKGNAAPSPPKSQRLTLASSSSKMSS